MLSYRRRRWLLSEVLTDSTVHMTAVLYQDFASGLKNATSSGLLNQIDFSMVHTNTLVFRQPISGSKLQYIQPWKILHFYEQLLCSNKLKDKFGNQNLLEFMRKRGKYRKPVAYSCSLKSHSEFHHWLPQEQKLSLREYVGKKQRQTLVHSETFHQPNMSFHLIII